MRAVWLEAVGSPLEVRNVTDPVVRASGALVRVLAVRVPSYTRKVFDGSLGYDIKPPFIPGPTCIGQVESFGEDVFDLEVGDVVLCNSLLSSGDIAGGPDEMLIAWTGNGSERSRAMQNVWAHGSFAQLAHYPARCLTTLPEAEKFERARLPFLASIAIADGGLRRADFQAGQSIVINGATGQLGGAAVMLALSYGATAIIATGRNKTRLQALEQLNPRVVALALTGRRAEDATNIRDLTNGGPDVVVDYLSNTPTPDQTLACFDALAFKGTMVLVGGVSHSLSIPYGQIMRRQLTIRGSFMFERQNALKCWNLVRSGAIDLSVIRPHAYSLDEVEQAIDKASSLGGLDYALLLPNG
jgi:NADPH:quinone reductase-like Zn-dependent oxidoreductase